MKILTIFVLGALAALFPLPVRGQGAADLRPSASSVRKAGKLLKRMSADEKIGQLVHIGINARYLHRESAEFQRLSAEVSELGVGGVIVFAGPVYETAHLVNRLQRLAKVPLLISADFESGVGMRLEDTVNFPWAMAIAATGDENLARKAGMITGREARAVGVRMVFAPVVDINDNPLNPVINVRSFGEDPSLVARMGLAFAEGLQAERVIATAKHFPGHGNTAVDSHLGLPVIDTPRDQIEANELFPFRKLVEGGVSAIMVSHIAVPALDPESITDSNATGERLPEGATVPATLSRKIVTDLLRTEMGFDGLIVTDALDMKGLSLFYDSGEAAVRAVLAGNDILLKPENAGQAIEGLKKAFKEGRITTEILDRAVLRQLSRKFELGLFENRFIALDGIDSVVSSPETVDLSRSIADRAITLVATEPDALPVGQDKRVLVLCVTNGPDISRVGMPFVSALRSRGIRAERIALDERSSPKEVEAAAARADEFDLVVAALFVRVRSGAENSTILPATGAEALRLIGLKGRSPAVVSFGNPYLINVLPQARIYIAAYGDMFSLQEAAAEKLAGGSDFSGKLPVSLNDRHRAGTGMALR